MQRCLICHLCVLIVCSFSGCSNEPRTVKAVGKVVRGDNDFDPEKEGGDVNLNVVLVPIYEDGGLPKNYYFCDVDTDTGRFTSLGPQKKGVPPGKYRVAVTLKKGKKDALGGKFGAANSPFVFEITDGSETLVCDLDNPP